MQADDIYAGNNFSITRSGGEWAVWRFSGDGGAVEQLVLTEAAMDELRDYFANYYAEDRTEIAAMREP